MQPVDVQVTEFYLRLSLPPEALVFSVEFSFELIPEDE